MATNISNLGAAARQYEKKHGTDAASKFVKMVKHLVSLSIDNWNFTTTKLCPMSKSDIQARHQNAADMVSCPSCHKNTRDKYRKIMDKNNSYVIGFSKCSCQIFENQPFSVPKEKRREICGECALIVTRPCNKHNLRAGEL